MPDKVLGACVWMVAVCLGASIIAQTTGPIILIRWMTLWPLKAEAERRAQAAAATSCSPMREAVR